MGQARQKYTQEYKDEAVELVVCPGSPIAEIAHDLGINEGTLDNWVMAAKKSGKLKGRPLDVSERARLKEAAPHRAARGRPARRSPASAWPHSLTAESFLARVRAVGYVASDSVGHIGGGIGVFLIAPRVTGCRCSGRCSASRALSS